jgi:hypothetical protein
MYWTGVGCSTACSMIASWEDKYEATTWSL